MLGAFIPSILRAYQRVICEGVVHLDVSLEITLKTMKEQTEKMKKARRKEPTLGPVHCHWVKRELLAVGFNHLTWIFIVNL